jgi:hypothetical protein
MSRVALGSPKIEGRIWPRTRVEDGGRYLGIPPKGTFQHSRVSRKPGAVHDDRVRSVTEEALERLRF